MTLQDKITNSTECTAIGEIHFIGAKPISLYKQFEIDGYAFCNPTINDLEDYFSHCSKCFITLSTRNNKHIIKVSNIAYVTLK